MKFDRFALAGGLALAALAWPQPQTHAGPTAKPNQGEPAVRGRTAGKPGVIDARANAVLRRMSDYLSGLKSFRVRATTIDELVAKDGQKIQQVKASQVAVRRPNGLRVDRVGPAGHAIFQYDGRQFGMASTERRIYATAAAPPTLAAAIDDARARLKIDAPGADLLSPNPYETLLDGMDTCRYIGLEPIDGVNAHHLAATKGVVDWQIWIQDGAQPLPLRFVITSKDLPARPEFTVEFRDWQPNVQLPDQLFTFTPPAGSRRVQFSASAKVKPQG